MGVCGAQVYAGGMAVKAAPEVQIFQLRMVLRGISPLIWRRLLVRCDSTVAQLHEALQVAFGWDDVHLNRFEIRGREYAVYRDGGGLIGIDANGVRLDVLSLRRLERFTYEYDFGDGLCRALRGGQPRQLRQQFGPDRHRERLDGGGAAGGSRERAAR